MDITTFVNLVDLEGFARLFDGINLNDIEIDPSEKSQVEAKEAIRDLWYAYDNYKELLDRYMTIVERGDF